LGKEKNRRGETVHEGRTPIAAVGTSDMHAQTQQHQGGKKNKLVTTIAVEDFGDDEITLPREGPWTRELAFVAGRSFGRLLRAARVANEEALAADGRPSCAIAIPRLSPYTLGQLFLFFELATAFEGELLDVNAFDQPGVENYKKLMKELLR
ncbi:MAG TPA: glucose-6-phosphate isomerase, partial [Acidobacteriota bacterium]|nr:glucose-6-phosphate isomerase [Acidobacteriota bacterium]HQP74236.1 glucose-6-phosphate isomerase [Acidobacteriota bacterium]